MKFVEPSKLHRKSGIWGTLSLVAEPSLDASAHIERRSAKLVEECKDCVVELLWPLERREMAHAL
jgi:hypothetical protein